MKDILETASYALLNDLSAIENEGTPEQSTAAAIATQALLALRDTIKRPDSHVYAARMESISRLVMEVKA